jgi:hypothetical protein
MAEQPDPPPTPIEPPRPLPTSEVGLRSLADHAARWLAPASEFLAAGRGAIRAAAGLARLGPLASAPDDGTVERTAREIVAGFLPCRPDVREDIAALAPYLDGQARAALSRLRRGSLSLADAEAWVLGVRRLRDEIADRLAELEAPRLPGRPRSTGPVAALAYQLRLAGWSWPAVVAEVARRHGRYATTRLRALARRHGEEVGVPLPAGEPGRPRKSERK